MYATAQRVRSTGGKEGLNGFLHMHGPGFPWPPDPWNLPETRPGEQVSEDVDVPPGGNNVRSYLDVIAPDKTPADEIDAALTSLWLELSADESGLGAPQEPLPNPVVYCRGLVFLRLEVEAALLASRASEMAALRRIVEPGAAIWRRANPTDLALGFLGSREGLSLRGRRRC
jgi:hypothetical protein